MFNLRGHLTREAVIGLIRDAPSLGVIQFISLTFLSAIFYPSGFNFHSQYFSELGATMARNGELNRISSSLFLVSNVVIGLTLIPFWLEMPSILGDTRGVKVAGKTGSALGLISSPFIIGAALCPFDTKLDMHFRMFLVFFPLFNAASLVYSIAIILDRRINEKYGVFGLLLFVISIWVMLNPLASYVCFLQKILLYGYFIWVLILNRSIDRSI